MEWKNQSFDHVVFLSGGTALHGVSSYIGYHNTVYVHEHDENRPVYNTTHIITCFDSGGSSAILRDVITDYPAVGDLRNRICSIAQGMDEAYQSLGIKNGHVALVHLCKYRLPNESECFQMNLTSVDLGAILTSFAQYLMNSNKKSLEMFDSRPPNGHPVYSQLIQFVENISMDIRQLCSGYLQLFLDYLTEKMIVFNYFNASIGNIILTGAYLHRQNNLEAATLDFCQLLGVYFDNESCSSQYPFIRVVPSSTSPLTLGAHLRSGASVIGQHAITSPKGSYSGLSSPIQSIFLVDYHTTLTSQSIPEERFAQASIEATKALLSAHLICYSIGSFFTSLLASIIPIGISTAIRCNKHAKKVFIPNMIFDPEMIGLSLHESALVLIQMMHKYDPNRHDPSSFSFEQSLTSLSSDYLSFVILDQLSLRVLSCHTSSPTPNIPYSHFGSYIDILQSIEILRNKIGITVIEADICGYVNEKTEKIEIIPAKLFEVLKQLQRCE